MPSTDRRLELKAKDIDGSDHLTAGCVCQWVKKKCNCTIFVLHGMVGHVGDDGVRECRFSVDGSFQTVRGFVHGNVQTV